MPTGANDKKTAVGAGESSDPAGLRLKKIETCARLGLVAQKGGYKSPLRADYPPLPPVLIPVSLSSLTTTTFAVTTFVAFPRLEARSAAALLRLQPLPT
eukprot:CAMPEP_0171902642 /NCGR_PEP_ID=MMETSP0993-20121228/2022_1 /TAXON_ID=483369 /ORGANISM="non described non described, Strain CCMP2098" /LENGTH=98 /DNA_ID=CAMNT_0012532319 /DNA_START=159 /DNA_END=453 /DNA_ORIENTATION=+